jgi:hypothetical protein
MYCQQSKCFWKTCKNFVFSFFHRKSILHQQNTINEKYKINRRTYIRRNMKTVISNLHHLIVEKPGLLGLCSVCLGNFFLTFRKNMPFLSAGLPVHSPTHNPTHEGCTFLRNVGKQLPNQKTGFLNMKTGLQVLKSSSAVSILLGRAQPARYTSRTLRCSIVFLPLVC